MQLRAHAATLSLTKGPNMFSVISCMITVLFRQSFPELRASNVLFIKSCNIFKVSVLIHLFFVFLRQGVAIHFRMALS